jgi:hypothetical protein
MKAGVLRSRVLSLAGAVALLGSPKLFAAQGEMGTGIPEYGTYAAAQGGHTAVWILNDTTIPMKAGCSALYLWPSTFGAEAYKIAVATLLAAKVSGRRVRLYSHVETGCAVDYIQIMD